MDTRNYCSGCAGVDSVYSCSSPIRRAPAHTWIVKMDEPMTVSWGNPVPVKEECGVVEAIGKATFCLCEGGGKWQ
ncbi:hypothetical protein AAHA92_28098 [Salvia divinorum]|uniref:Uncharacterized protein n=1 Tax=Salvia divinorum TaxID=28513 RepID=A0ABD1FWE3_SALDI